MVDGMTSDVVGQVPRSASRTVNQHPKQLKITAGMKISANKVSSKTCSFLRTVTGLLRQLGYRLDISCVLTADVDQSLSRLNC